MSVTPELRDGIARWRAAATLIYESLGGAGSAVTWRRPDGQHMQGILRRIVDCQGFAIETEGKIYLAPTTWEHPGSAEPGNLLCTLVKLPDDPNQF